MKNIGVLFWLPGKINKKTFAEHYASTGYAWHWAQLKFAYPEEIQVNSDQGTHLIDKKNQNIKN